MRTEAVPIQTLVAAVGFGTSSTLGFRSFLACEGAILGVASAGLVDETLKANWWLTAGAAEKKDVGHKEIAVERSTVYSTCSVASD